MISTDFLPIDTETVSHQLGGRDVFISKVILRCVHGAPQVVLLSPVSYTAVATPLWLCCPYLNKKIHAIESQGQIKRIEKMLSDDDSLVKQMQRAHEHYIAYRKENCNDFFENNSDSKTKELFETGIGGIRDTHRLKCLHLAAAHYALCCDNVAGKTVFELIGEDKYCVNGECLLAESV